MKKKVIFTLIILLLFTFHGYGQSSKFLKGTEANKIENSDSIKSERGDLLLLCERIQHAFISYRAGYTPNYRRVISRVGDLILLYDKEQDKLTNFAKDDIKTTPIDSVEIITAAYDPYGEALGYGTSGYYCIIKIELKNYNESKGE